jgi:DNA end-binding protein Ku
MAQAVWTGSISFGLVVIPVRLYPATEPKDVRFHLYDRRTGKRVRYERVTRAEDAAVFAPDPDWADESDETYDAPADATRARGESTDAHTDADGAAPTGARGPERTSEIRDWLRESPAASEPVEREYVVRGIELPEGDLVTVSDDELAAVAPERSRTIDIEEFVDLADIDPVFFEKSYHVAPARRMGAEKPYELLLRAMQESRMVGIGRFVLRTRPHLVAIRPLERTLALETLYFGDEVRSPDEFAVRPSDVAISEREVKTARQLIGAMATTWEPSAHADAYREELLGLLRSKTPAVPVPADATPSPVAEIDGLMSALRASVEAAKQKRTAKASSSKRAG